MSLLLQIPLSTSVLILNLPQNLVLSVPAVSMCVSFQACLNRVFFLPPKQHLFLPTNKSEVVDLCRPANPSTAAVIVLSCGKYH